MTPERWQQIEEIFDSALEREANERAAFLNEACIGDEKLRKEVESLLAHQERAGTVIQAVVQGEAQDLTDAHKIPDGPQQIGPYKILREIGRGGMGGVYLAARADDQYRKRVAIKLIRRGMDTEDILRRFRNERQILASLDHPNIARLLDGGTTADGLPYFVMEYIEGKSINDYCDTHKLSTIERLKLFRTVCAAVHYAHQNLVVHRDLKPSNIVVTTEGVTKLLDFGIAKLLNPELSGQTIAPTATAVRLMTPEYASPEQVRGETITTSSDVYSLGVLLYELLTGHRPYRVKSRAPREIVHAICEVEPEKPSTIVNRTEELPSSDGSSHITVTPESVSRTREGQPDKLSRKLSGDLDNIVLMAMRKEPQRRYSSVGQFAEDIRRHLEGLPVVARKDTFSYRAEKFVKRNKTGVAVAALIMVLLIAGIAVTLVQSARVRTERDIAARERDRAARERDRAEQVSAFMTELFLASAPWEAKGNTVTAREILDRGAERIQQELKDQPEVQTKLMDTMVNAYSGLGLYDRALPLAEESLRIRREKLGPEHPDLPRSLGNVAEFRQVMGDYKAAEELFRERIALQRKLLGNENRIVAQSLNDLALIRKLQGDYAEGEALYRECLEVGRKVRGGNDPYHLNNYGSLLRDKGDYEGAEPIYREALALFRKGESEDPNGLSFGLGNMGTLLRLKGDYEAAEPLLRQSLEIRRRMMRDAHPDLAVSLTNLALLLLDKNDYRAAEPMLREALVMRRKLLGEEHLQVASSLHNLASLLHDTGDYAEAEALYRRALQLRRKLPNEQLAVATTLVALGRLLTDRKDARGAETLLREATQIQSKLPPADQTQVAEAKSVFGYCLTTLKRFDEAEPLLLESYTAIKAKRGERSKPTERARTRLVNLYTAWGKADKAAAYRPLL